MSSHLLNVKGISFPKEHGLQEMPYVGIPPMFGHNVSGVFLTRDMGKVDKSSGDGFSHEVEGEHVVPLMQFGMRLCGTLHHGFVVPEYITVGSIGHGVPRVLQSKLV